MRQSILIAGAEQTGKTYFAESIANKYTAAGGTAVIYNSGKDSDFSGAAVCTPVSVAEMIASAGSKLERSKIQFYESLPLFRDENSGKVLRFSDFSRFYRGKKVRIYRHQNESLLIKSFFTYLYNCLVIFDDNRASTRAGLSHQQVEFFSRKNHAGARFSPPGMHGCDIVFIYHNLDYTTPELYDYLTRIVLFRLNRMPGERIKNGELWDAIELAVNSLKTAPRFSKVEILLRDYEEIKTIKRFNK